MSIRIKLGFCLSFSNIYISNRQRGSMWNRRILKPKINNLHIYIHKYQLHQRTTLKSLKSCFSTACSFLNSALAIRDWGLPVVRSQFCICWTLEAGPCSCPWTVPASVFWTHPTSPSFLPSDCKHNTHILIIIKSLNFFCMMLFSLKKEDKIHGIIAAFLNTLMKYS